MPEILAVPSEIVRFNAEEPFTPTMIAVVYMLAAEIKRRKVKSTTADGARFYLSTPEIKGPDAADNNRAIRHAMDRLLGVRLAGRKDAVEWGAVMVAEWVLEAGSQTLEVFVPRMALRVLSAPKNFAQIEAQALFNLRGSARLLYMALADKRRLTRQSHWVYDLPELRDVMGVGDALSYKRWAHFKRRILDPAIADIRANGTVELTWTATKAGKKIVAVRFDWEWKDLVEAEKTAKEVDRHSKARGKEQTDEAAPPLIVDGEPDEAQKLVIKAIGGDEYRKFFHTRPKPEIKEGYLIMKGPKPDFLKSRFGNVIFDLPVKFEKEG
jgi:hypothetical protein